jgi:hypothetical protein
MSQYARSPSTSSGRTDKYLDLGSSNPVRGETLSNYELDCDTVSPMGKKFFSSLVNAGEFLARGKGARS